MIDWMVVLTALLVGTALITLVSGLFAFIRKNDMVALAARYDSIEKRMAEHDVDITKKLNEVDFRRFEERNELALRNMAENNRNDIRDLNNKIDEKFEKLYILLQNRP